MKKFILGLLVGVLVSIPVFSYAAISISSRLSGRILLQVESKGEAWYVNPVDGKRYYMANGNEAYNIMRKLGLGITNKDLAQIAIAKESAMVDSAEKTYKTIKTFSGSGKFHTEEFSITGEKFKVIWSHTGTGNFLMTANDEEDPRSTCWMGNVTGNFAKYDVCTAYSKGNFSLNIITDGNWTVEIQDYKY